MHLYFLQFLTATTSNIPHDHSSQPLHCHCPWFLFKTCPTISHAINDHFHENLSTQVSWWSLPQTQLCWLTFAPLMIINLWTSSQSSYPRQIPQLQALDCNHLLCKSYILHPLPWTIPCPVCTDLAMNPYHNCKSLSIPLLTHTSTTWPLLMAPSHHLKISHLLSNTAGLPLPTMPIAHLPLALSFFHYCNHLGNIATLLPSKCLFFMCSHISFCLYIIYVMRKSNFLLVLLHGPASLQYVLLKHTLLSSSAPTSYNPTTMAREQNLGSVTKIQSDSITVYPRT